MHLLAAQPGAVGDGTEAVDLGQAPGDLLVLSAADTELAALAAAEAELPAGRPSLRLANLLQLGHPMSVDLWVGKMVPAARLVVARLLGGAGYWSYGVEQLEAACAEAGVPLVLLPGDDKPDPQLARRSTVPAEAGHRLWQYLVQGGPENARGFLAYAASLAGHACDWPEPKPLLRAGLYWPDLAQPTLAELQARWQEAAPVAAIVFYRAHVQAGNLKPVDALIAALQAEGVNPLPLYCASLKEPVSADTVAALLEEGGAGIVLNATGFAVSSPGGERSATPFDVCDCPVLQVVFAGSSEAAWRAGTNGLSARDIAMNVALPEVDGRILSRAVSFKGAARWDAATQCQVVQYEPVADRVAFVAGLAANWLRLRGKVPAERRVAVVLANYPNRDGRLGNGVGLDTPAGTVEALRALAEAGYAVADLPADGEALIARLAAGPTNAATDGREIRETLALADYEAFLEGLPAAVREAVTGRWGAPERDPFFLADREAFALPAFRLGRVLVGLQPARGYNIDPVGSYHDPALVPPHGYLAFYAFLRREADAVIHMGKHGNLEWLPGKSIALGADCFPESVLGPLPHLYPFIVNDPGEGTQAKRRAQAVIVDHLTPPLTRAESYGPLKDLEALVDEYYEAAGVDPRRLALLRREILELSQRLGLDKDLGFDAGDETAALSSLDNHLCELKELQIRDGLHVFGRSPEGRLLTDLLVALARVPRGEGPGGGGAGEASLLRALAGDLGLGDFDPLTATLGEPWDGPRPEALAGEAAWRTKGDTVERLESLAQALVGGERPCDPAWPRTAAVLDTIETRLRPAVEASGAAELAGLLRALDGRFLAPGPSGAPTRGKPEVLPTGRNFYSVDSRTVPTPAAWTLGWKSACLLLERHRQDHGAWPKALALSAWGTANMRTGGDDLAQALALIGVRPTWDQASRRVTGFEVLPLSLLDRPRVDVTLRVSGFFRDAFPAQIELFDSAVRAVAALDEPEAMNPLAARSRAEAARLEGEGLDAETAARRAGYRVFGSMPGAYGAGLQALIDERGWESAEDLARAYTAWSGYAYGAGSQGEAAHGLFERRLAQVEAVLHNQDNREHDLLDSDDYYQFEGGLAVAVKTASGREPAVYHNDHSRPERPVVRSLKEEIARVVRARVVNPKWIAGVMRHGYKGAFEMAATVDYLFAFAATTGAVGDHHFDAVWEAYLEDEAVRAFLEDKNPAALQEMAERLREAIDRGLWQPRANAAYGSLERLSGGRAP
ncbi:cobaltochelatase CobN subunit [Tistlia consotensis]|uniref:Cobaltochelatase subunit CobN n=1 Tax=Tistlia consotensis USBA 355 TaxID=560819 RepID=A0A1Y6BPA9_9PROT|nr:cobaltochelatase subunit CobN [Tistlia consotensis]SMF22251.1 cobaltochelatase CobN subunit [Tistlia consotensis USBA 355]SNR46155.1 cobaltochelatase CobN subunit [Tistlia consotensis]